MNNPLSIIGNPPNNWEVNETFVNITRQSLPSRQLLLETETKMLELDLTKTAFLVIETY